VFPGKIAVVNDNDDDDDRIPDYADGFDWDLHTHPRIAWDWRALRLPPGAQEDQNSRNDTGAGLYVFDPALVPVPGNQLNPDQLLAPIHLPWMPIDVTPYMEPPQPDGGVDPEPDRDDDADHDEDISGDAVAPPGVLTPRGEPVACRVNQDTGLFLIEAAVNGDSVPLGVDTGSAGTWVSTRLTRSWLERHPEWPNTVGAVGSANFFGHPFEAEGVLLSLPEIGIGGIGVSDVAALGLGQGLFDWYSQKSAAPVAGFIGANVLSRCRLEVDWPNRMTWWELGPDPGQRDLDIVGLTLRPALEGSYTVAGVVTRDEVPAVGGVEAGDLLVRVGELETAGATMGEVVTALRGRPGEVRTLLLERNGDRLTVEAPVERFP